MTRFVLASASPRRADLLRAAGFVFDVCPAHVDERPLAGEAPHAYVRRLAEEKAAAVAATVPAPVVAADTVVVIDGEILGKPVDDADARRMLAALSGRVHVVMTGVAVVAGVTVVEGGRGGPDRFDLTTAPRGEKFSMLRAHRTRVEVTAVELAPLSTGDIDWYVASGEPRDKAGGYAIQGLASRFVVRIEGSYSNVVGLPVEAVYRMFRELGFFENVGENRRGRD